MDRRWLIGAGILVSAIGLILIGHYLSGEWKPVGDGKSIMHSRTGEVRKIEDDLPDLTSIAGTWYGWKDNQRRTITIGPRSIFFSDSPTAICKTVDAGKGWWIVEMTSGGSKAWGNWRIELSDDGTKLTCNRDVYTRTASTQPSGWEEVTVEEFLSGKPK